MKKKSFEEYQQMILMEGLCTEGCETQRLFNVCSNKWVPQVLFELTKAESLRFGELKRSINGITNTMLSSTLKSLEGVGLINRTQFNEIPPHVEYALSQKGKALYPVFVEIINWAMEYGV